MLLKFSLKKEINLSSGVFTVVEPSRNVQWKSLTSLLKTLSENKKYTYKCFVGDYNFKDIEWPSMSTHKDEESKETKFIETIHDCFLYQHVSLPTRCRGTDQPSTIDLVLTNEEQQIRNLSHLPPLGKSDHCILSLEFICEIDEHQVLPKYQYHNYRLPINGNRSHRVKLEAKLFG